MKRKPSKRTMHNTKKRRWMHSTRYATTITLSDMDFGADTIYFDTGPMNFTFENGGYITIKDLNTEDWGTKVHYGKNPKSVHPARRNKEKKKVRIEANITSCGQTITISKIDSDTWIIEGEIT